jgi:hypothetical protein
MYCTQTVVDNSLQMKTAQSIVNPPLYIIFLLMVLCRFTSFMINLIKVLTTSSLLVSSLVTGHPSTKDSCIVRNQVYQYHQVVQEFSVLDLSLNQKGHLQ